MMAAAAAADIEGEETAKMENGRGKDSSREVIGPQRAANVSRNGSPKLMPQKA